MKTTLALVLVMFSPVSLLQAADPTELQRLREQYNVAVQRALAPVQATYQQQLERLMDSYTKGGKLNEALSVKAEIDKLRSGTVAATVATPQNSKLRSYFVGRTWGTSATNFTFHEDGTGVVQWDAGKDPFKWEIIDGSVVRVQRPDKTSFFFFESRQKGKMADHLEGTRKDIEPK